MELLHVFSNWKWTGPAEPALNLAVEQRRRGHAVAMAVGDPGRGERYFHEQVAERGVELIDGLRLSKHSNPLRNLSDSRRLAGILHRRSFDCIHAHLPNDHAIAGRAVRVAGSGTPIVRTSYEAEGPPPGVRSQLLLRRHTSALVVSSPEAERVARSNFEFLDGRLYCVEPAVDTERFDRSRGVVLPHHELGVPEDAFLVGLVARIQEHRRFDVFVQAIALASRVEPAIHGGILGRASLEDQERLVHAPARALGVGDRLHKLEPRRGEEYVGLLAALDLEVFLMPGSDGSCRAVREALAMGVPVVGARRGMIPEIIEDGVTGLVVEDEPALLAKAILDLARDPERRQRMGRTAASSARVRFSPERMGAAYEEILAEAVG